MIQLTDGIFHVPMWKVHCCVQQSHRKFLTILNDLNLLPLASTNPCIINLKTLGDLWVANRSRPRSPQWSKSHSLLFFPLILAQNVLLKCRAASQIIVLNLLLLYTPVELKQLHHLQLKYSTLTPHEKRVWPVKRHGPVLTRAEQLITLRAHPGGEEKQLYCFPSEMTEKVSRFFF